jgi:lysophospholipase L1-like esterase
MRSTLRRFKQIFHRLQTGWSIVGVTLALVVLLELGLQGFFWVKDRSKPRIPPDPRVVAAVPDGALWLDRHYRELEAISDRWQPYVYFRQRLFQGQTITINAEGLRATWAPPPTVTTGESRPPVKLLMLGGSSLWGFGARDDHTIPSLIARALDERGVRVQIRNLSEIGYVNTQETIALVRELQQGYRPDVVLFYDGVNDTTSALLEREATVTTNEINRVREFNLLQSPSRLTTALIGKLVATSALFRLASSAQKRLTRAPAGDPRLPSQEERRSLSNKIVRGYVANVRLVEALGKSYGFRPVFFWQPVIYFKSHRVPFEEEEAAKFAWTATMFGDVQTLLSSDAYLTSDSAFLDLSEIFKDIEELVFLDFCHTTEEANARIAETVVARLAETGVLSFPAQSGPH